MKKTTLFLTFIFLSVAFFAQTRLSVHPDFMQLAKEHKIIAILPLKTSIALRPKQMAKLEGDDLEKMQRNESYHIQRAMFSWFLKRKEQDKLWVEVQDIDETNKRLSENGIEYAQLENYTAEELAKLLNVDAVILGSFRTNKPMSDGASLAVGLLIGFYASTNQATINMYIKNGADGKMLVNYHKMVAGSVGSTSDQLINILMRKASRRIPYTKPKE